LLGEKLSNSYTNHRVPSSSSGYRLAMGWPARQGIMRCLGARLPPRLPDCRLKCIGCHSVPKNGPDDFAGRSCSVLGVCTAVQVECSGNGGLVIALETLKSQSKSRNVIIPGYTVHSWPRRLESRLARAACVTLNLILSTRSQRHFRFVTTKHYAWWAFNHSGGPGVSGTRSR